MNESLRDLLRKGADTVDRPRLDVGNLVEQAERRLVRRRLVAVGATAVTVAAITVGGLALRPDEHRSSPPPPDLVETPDTPPVSGSAIYFAALADAGDALTGQVDSIEGDMDLFLAREGEPVQRIIATGQIDGCPRVSPKGARLAYLEGADVVVVALDSAGEPGDTELRVDLGSWRHSEPPCPEWSPDGRRLAVVAQGQESATTEPPDELRVVTLDGKEQQLALVPGVNVTHSFAWLPDGDAVAYITQDAVWVAPLDGTAPELLWRGTATPDPDPYGLPLAGAPDSMSWSDTGEFAVSVFPDRALHVVDPDSGRDQVIGALSTEVSAAAWSPDGSRLAFVDGRGRLRMYDRADGSTATLRPKLANVDGFVIFDVAWSRDGDRLVAGAGREPAAAGAGPFALVSIATDGSSVEVLTPWTNALYWTYMEDVSWSPR